MHFSSSGLGWTYGFFFLYATPEGSEVIDLPLGTLLAPGVFLQGSVKSPICEWQNEVLYGFGIGASLLAGLEVSLSSLLFTDGLVFLLIGCKSAEVFGSLYSGLGFLL